jgi:putative ABC transport system permease protein
MTILIQTIADAWRALLRSKTRSTLTMLGIVWGIVTVTLLVAYGSSFRTVLVRAFEAFGRGAVVCWPAQTSEQPGGQRAGKVVRFEQADLDRVKQEATLVKVACLETVRWLSVSYQGRLANTAIRGVCPEYGEIRNEAAKEGRWIAAQDQI